MAAATTNSNRATSVHLSSDSNRKLANGTQNETPKETLKEVSINQENLPAKQANGIIKQNVTSFSSTSLASSPSTNSCSSSSNVASEIGPIKKFTLDCLLAIVKFLIVLYDLLSQPVFYFKHQVYKRQYEIDQVERSRQLDPLDPNSPWMQSNIEARQSELEAKIDKYSTYDELMSSSFKQHRDQICYGYRELLEERITKRSDSDKQVKQVSLSQYKWVTYGQFEQQVEAAKRGFLLEGIQAGDRVVLYADTRPEWQISSQALVRLGAVVVTMYSTLGVDGIVHSVNETQVTHIVAQQDKVSKLLALKSKLDKLTKIIYFDSVLKFPKEIMKNQGGSDYDNDNDKNNNNENEHLLNNNDTNINLINNNLEHNENIECISFKYLLELGLKSMQLNSSEWKQFIELDKVNELKRSARNKDSIAVIMYTSGSTGVPKGVLISHRNIMACIKSFTHVTKDFVYNPKDNVCTAYLPLAHIFEFCIESMLLFHGVRFGFATPQTLTDKSPGLLAGQKGDLTLLKPSVMIIVPLILDRVVQGIKQAISSQSYFKAQLIDYLIRYKIYWQRKHYETPLVDKIVCSKVSLALGGRTKFVICGSAPLSGETQVFARAALNLKLPQGFGTTETCAATACQLFDDQSTGNVGLPVSGARIKLEPWHEGNYRPSDKPRPRGEIVVGGEMIAHGYYNLDEQTKEAFYVDEEGIRWYRTGDIGEFLSNGALRIIDRKKDLVKLQNGEYISLGRVESTLKSNPYTDNFCVYAHSAHNFVVALGPANEAAIVALAREIVDEAPAEMRSGSNSSLVELTQLLASYDSDLLNNNTSLSFDKNELDKGTSGGSNERLERLCENELILERVMQQLKSLAHQRNLMSLEIPRRLLLLPEEWTEDKNLVTAAMKIRRNYIYKRYERQLEQLYASA